MKNTILALALLIGAGLITAHADTFGTGDAQFTLDFTTIGNPGNAADRGWGDYGSVGYTYRIGTYAISQSQIDKATASGLAYVTAGPWSGDKPAANMTWFESAAFVNWLNTSKGFQPAYNLTWSGSTWSMALWTVTDAGYDANNLYRNSLAKYFLPSENEFYKAAYGKSDGSGDYFYFTTLDTVPTAVASGTSAGTAVYGQSWDQGPASVYEAGGLSSYGTMGQGGNVWQWQESAYDGVNDDASKDRAILGGAWYSGISTLGSMGRYPTDLMGRISPDGGPFSVGFRVASVADVGVAPEPSTYALFGLGAIGMLMVMRRKKSA
jgi:formylglycine-generating enzyme required for sulfatase activity